MSISICKNNGMTEGFFQVSTGKKQNVGNDEYQKSIVKNGGLFVGKNQSGLFGAMQYKDKADQTKQNALKEALKTLVDQLTKELAIDDTVEELKAQNEQLNKDIESYSAELDKVDENRAAIKEEYGITDDCEEEQMLNIIRKSNDDPDSMTDEEWEKLDSVDEFTDYQKAALELDDTEENYTNLISDAKDQLKANNESVEAIRLARLKTHPMVDAGKEAADILKTASAAVVSELLKEAMEHIDETFAPEDEDETATEEAEEKKKDEEDPVQQAIENAQSGTSKTSTYDKERILSKIKDLLKALGITGEDSKGIVIDTSL